MTITDLYSHFFGFNPTVYLDNASTGTSGYQNSQNLGFFPLNYFLSFDPNLPNTYTFDLALYSGADKIANVDMVVNVAAVPEPSTWAMMILGFAGIGYVTYRRRKTAALAT